MANSTASTNQQFMYKMMESNNILWLCTLFLLGCGPTWYLILKAEYKWRKYRSSPDRHIYYHKRTTLDLLYLWARRVVTLNAGFYFMTALSLTPPELFQSMALTPTFSFSTFISRDMLALKHVTHACFFWAGHANFWSSGNAHPMEICRVIFILTTFASTIAFITSIQNCIDNGILSNLIVSTIGLILSFSSALLTWLVINKSLSNHNVTSSKPISTLKDRLNAVLQYISTNINATQTTQNNEESKINAAPFWKVRKIARIGLWIHISVLCLSSLFKIFYTSNGFVQGTYRTGVLSTKSAAIHSDVFMEAYVEALSLGLHWGFIIGCGLHGVRWCSLSSLETYTWGSFLLILPLFIGTRRFPIFLFVCSQ
jgi:hypothetical protein